jgi:exosortase K
MTSRGLNFAARRNEVDMKPNPRQTRIAQLIVVLACAMAIKLYYSTASVNDLLWILAPTTLLVELITGVEFAFESNAGYMSSDHSFLIAASCSGVNFLITAFLMLSLGRLWKCRTQIISWIFIPLSMLAAYLTTILANTFRISTALQIRRLDHELIWLNPDQLHRFEGIVIYFGFLLLLFVVSEKIGSQNDASPKVTAGMLKRSLLSLLIYYATTLGVPLANGLYHGGSATSDFWEHSLFVLLVPPLLLFVLASLSFFNDRRSLLRVRKWH